MSRQLTIEEAQWKAIRLWAKAEESNNKAILKRIMAEHKEYTMSRSHSKGTIARHPIGLGTMG